MNIVMIIGRLARDPEVRYTQDGTAIANMTVAVDRGKDRNGNDLPADFPRVQVFGKQAENCGKYLSKGRLVGVQGRIQTGSYTNKNGDKVYTTDIVASRVEFLEKAEKQQQNYSGGYGQPGQNVVPNTQYQQDANHMQPGQQLPAGQQAAYGWENIDDGDIPF